eukprot:bmy_15154T0
MGVEVIDKAFTSNISSNGGKCNWRKRHTHAKIKSSKSQISHGNNIRRGRFYEAVFSMYSHSLIGISHCLLRIHLYGWEDNYDQWVEVSERRAFRLFSSFPPFLWPTESVLSAAVIITSALPGLRSAASSLNQQSFHSSLFLKMFCPQLLTASVTCRCHSTPQQAAAEAQWVMRGEDKDILLGVGLYECAMGYNGESLVVEFTESFFDISWKKSFSKRDKQSLLP